jgi:hypothetical protein
LPGVRLEFEPILYERHRVERMGEVQREVKRHAPPRSGVPLLSLVLALPSPRPLTTPPGGTRRQPPPAHRGIGSAHERSSTRLENLPKPAIEPVKTCLKTRRCAGRSPTCCPASSWPFDRRGDDQCFLENGSGSAGEPKNAVGRAAKKWKLRRSIERRSASDGPAERPRRRCCVPRV